MIDYRVTYDKENNNFIVDGPFLPNAVPVEIPFENPQRKPFIDLFLHKADIDRGIDFLDCIAPSNNTTLNEALFIAGLNNCMKCFKYSKSRTKIEKAEVFASAQQLYENFINFETMRDKHYDHDENGMLQASAFLPVCSEGETIFGGPPSVVWNRSKLDYCLAGKLLKEIMLFVQKYLCCQIDETGRLIIEKYKKVTREALLEFQPAQIQFASFGTKR